MSEKEKIEITKIKRKKKKGANLTNVLLVILLLLGIGIIAYPTVSDRWNARHATQAIASYVEQMEQMEDGTKAQMLEEAEAYNRALETGVHLNLSEEAYAEYTSVLDITGTGIMGYVQIPTINVNLPIYHGTDESVLQIATGHIAGSSLPIGGKGTHAAISGHRGLPSAKLFTDLDKLIVGDIFVITVLDRKVTYQVDQIHIVLPDEVSDLAIEKEKDYMTLVTCTPYGVNSHRMLVRGHRIDNLESEEEILVTADARRISATVVMICFAVVLLFAALLISMFFAPEKKKKQTQRAILEELEKTFQTGGKDDEEK